MHLLTCVSLVANLSNLSYSHSSSDLPPLSSGTTLSPSDVLPEPSKLSEASVFLWVSWASSDACENTQVFIQSGSLSGLSWSDSDSGTALLLCFFLCGCSRSFLFAMPCLLVLSGCAPPGVGASWNFAGSLQMWVECLPALLMEHPAAFSSAGIWPHVMTPKALKVVWVFNQQGGEFLPTQDEN